MSKTDRMKQISKEMAQMQGSFLTPEEQKRYDELSNEAAEISFSPEYDKERKEAEQAGQLNKPKTKPKKHRKTEEEKIREYQEHYPKFIQTGTPKPIMAQTDQTRGYECKKHCHQIFPTLPELAQHMRSVHAAEKRREQHYQQVTPPTKISKNYKDVGVVYNRGCPRIAATSFIPKDVIRIRIFEPVAAQEGFWVLFKPLLRTSSKVVST